ncbi:MAG: glutamate--cysteine ligase [Deltaproteobacteria bacterium]|nr:glutamate--cysteine ligase [Deltaproteobacteria bacterium]
MLHHIAENFLKNRDKIESFFAEKTKGLVPPLYLSCDIRNSGHKIGVVDTNLFPAGFNNLCNSYSRLSGFALKAYFETYLPEVRSVLVLAEEHTRNRFYLENVLRLLGLLEAAGIKVRAVYAGEEIAEPSFEADLGQGKVLRMERLRVRDGRPYAGDFAGDWILSNNDFSQGLPQVLSGLEARISPPPGLGWHRRRKSVHFSRLRGLIQEFAARLEIDPWLLDCEFATVDEVELGEESGVRRLAEGVDRVLEKVEAQYRRYGIESPAYAFVKNNAGTYGMGLMEVMSSRDILNMNRRDRNKLLSAKGGKKGDSFLVQEGIPTADFYSGYPIEPVIYMVGFQVVGGFFRMNAQRDAFASLNARGMEFACLCLHKLDEPHEGAFLNCAEKGNLVSLASVMARIAALAAAEEMREL